MAPLDSLPPDQRAVIQMVLQRGRSYDDIAALLSIDRASVRQRALDAFDALGPASTVPDMQRALLTDYLLGQLPSRVAEQVRGQVAESPADRAWLRVIAGELSPLASAALPEIPAARPRRVKHEPPRTEPEEPRWRHEAQTDHDQPAEDPHVVFPADAERTLERPRELPERPSSRRGGAILLGIVGAAIVAAIILAIVLSSSSGHTNPRTTAVHPRTTTGSAGTPTTSTGTTTTTSKTKLLAQVNLLSPSGQKNVRGVGEVVRQGATLGVLIVASVPPNTKRNAYAVWLYNSGSDAKLLGFVNQRVSSSRKLETQGAFPADASHYRELLITVETSARPKTPGKIVLQGKLRLT